MNANAQTPHSSGDEPNLVLSPDDVLALVELVREMTLQDDHATRENLLRANGFARADFVSDPLRIRTGVAAQFIADKPDLGDDEIRAKVDDFIKNERLADRHADAGPVWKRPDGLRINFTWFGEDAQREEFLAWVDAQFSWTGTADIDGTLAKAEACGYHAYIPWSPVGAYSDMRPRVTISVKPDSRQLHAELSPLHPDMRTTQISGSSLNYGYMMVSAGRRPEGFLA
ncbi:hypothetical protein [Aliiroseovarius sp. YM-037]|uniref:hypothetical protein n=1 Tax=Aliiroseovarius sp. YM-037 TaxID=3341728 RepID=UPI003A80CEAC